MSAHAIRATALTKSFSVSTGKGKLRREQQTVTAVDALDLCVPTGAFTAIIGPNGAGKSTALKMFTGILAPTNGELAVLGLTPLQDRTALAARIGVVFGQRSQLWWDLPLRDSFTLLRHLYRVPPATFTDTLQEMVDRFDLGPLLGQPVRTLSLGQRMRAELAAALLHKPELLFLDEPTIGLDVVSKFAMRDALRDLHARNGTTIVLTTHDLDDVEELCERVVIIDHGRIIRDQPIEALQADVANGTDLEELVRRIYQGEA